MKIQAFGLELIFDEINDNCQFLFLTTLVNVATFEIPERLPIIYTSETLKNQFTLYLKSEDTNFDEECFRVLKPYEAIYINSNESTKFEVLPCLPKKDMSTSFMLVFREVKTLRITHIYTGFTSDIGSIIVDTTFAKWLRASNGTIDNLYIPMNREIERCVNCEHENAYADVERQLNDDNIGKLLCRVPLFGCEAFIAHLASEYRGHIAINGLLSKVFAQLPNVKMQYFIEDLEMATILISTTDLPLDPNCSYETLCHRYKAKWLPQPGAYELSLLRRLVNPKNTFNINDIKHYEIVKHLPIQITKYSYTPTTESIPDTPLACQCFNTEEPIEPPTVFHSNITECIRHVVYLYTDKYVDVKPELTVEEQLEQMMGSPTTNSPSAAKNTSKPQIDVVNQHQQSDESVQVIEKNESIPIISSDEEPTTSKQAAAKRRRLKQQKSNVNAEQLTPKSAQQLKTVDIKSLVYRQGKKGLHFEDTSSSD